MPAKDALTRFSGRVEDYTRFRPGYPPDVLDTLTREFGLRPAQTIADVGSGTGISAELFLRHGNSVYAVEPNADMGARRGKTPRPLSRLPQRRRSRRGDDAAGREL